jgi:hypothetical protein
LSAINTAVTDEGWVHVLRVTRPALLLAPTSFLDDTKENLRRDGVIDAVAGHDDPVIFDWAQRLLAMQGVSDRAAHGYAQQHGYPTWAAIDTAMQASPACPKLASHWHLPGCGYEKASFSCAHPEHIDACTLPSLPLRKGVLNRAAFGLYLFMRDVAAGDFVGWVDGRLRSVQSVDAGGPQGADLRDALLDPLTSIPGTGRKLWSMALADLLLVGRPDDQLWQRAGAAMRAIDSLVHNFLDRTGCLKLLDAQHAYGPACYGPGGCSDVIEHLAQRTDARELNPAFPRYFPRFVQFALWNFCALDGRNICNGNTNADDPSGCPNLYCPAYQHCERGRAR